MNVNYEQIFSDILAEKYPDKMSIATLQSRLTNIRTAIDVIFLNNIIFGKSESNEGNQKLRSYDANAILYILEYQKKNNLSNSQLALHFRISRNTIAKWKKLNLSD